MHESQGLKSRPYVSLQVKPFLTVHIVEKGKGNENASYFQVIDKGNGRIALKSVSTGGYVTVKGLGLMADVRIEQEDQGESSTFQWQDMLRGDLMLMSVKTHRYLFADPFAGSLTSADAPGTRPDRKDGACFVWRIFEQ